MHYIAYSSNWWMDRWMDCRVLQHLCTNKANSHWGSTAIWFVLSNMLVSQRLLSYDYVLIPTKMWWICRHLPYTVVLKIIQPHLLFPVTSIVNKSCNIECCVYSILPINQNMVVSQGLELILNMFRRTTMSGQHPLIYVWVQNL